MKLNVIIVGLCTALFSLTAIAADPDAVLRQLEAAGKIIAELDREAEAGDSTRSQQKRHFKMTKRHFKIATDAVATWKQQKVWGNELNIDEAHEDSCDYLDLLTSSSSILNDIVAIAAHNGRNVYSKKKVNMLHDEVKNSYRTAMCSFWE